VQGQALPAQGWQLQWQWQRGFGRWLGSAHCCTLPRIVTALVQALRLPRSTTPTLCNLACPAPVPDLFCRPPKPLIYLILAPTIGLSCYMQWGNSDLAPLLGVAWDCGGVTTGPVTVPVSAECAHVHGTLCTCACWCCAGLLARFFVRGGGKQASPYLQPQPHPLTTIASGRITRPTQSTHTHPPHAPTSKPKRRSFWPWALE
jgi:hypothetical protein